MKSDTSKSTVLVISMGFLFLFFIFSLRWMLIVSFVVGTAGILSSSLSNKIEWVWMKLSHYLGYIVPNILLSIVFFLFLFPISALSRLFRNDKLMLSRRYKTYFVDINREIDKESFEKTW